MDQLSALHNRVYSLKDVIPKQQLDAILDQITDIKHTFALEKRYTEQQERMIDEMKEYHGEHPCDECGSEERVFELTCIECNQKSFVDTKRCLNRLFYGDVCHICAEYSSFQWKCAFCAETHAIRDMEVFNIKDAAFCCCSACREKQKDGSLIKFEPLPHEQYAEYVPELKK